LHSQNLENEKRKKRKEKEKIPISLELQMLFIFKKINFFIKIGYCKCFVCSWYNLFSDENVK